MKTCPTCNRTYSKDNFAFCLDDGAPLSFAGDASATVAVPSAHVTDPPKTEVLHPTLKPRTSRTPTLRASIPSSPPLVYAPADRPQASGGKHWIVLSGILGVLVIGLMAALGYITWRVSNRAAPESSSVAST